MKYIISALLITSGLVFVGLSQRYDYHGDQTGYRFDRLKGQLEECNAKGCRVVVKQTGVFKNLSSGN